MVIFASISSFPSRDVCSLWLRKCTRVQVGPRSQNEVSFARRHPGLQFIPRFFSSSDYSQRSPDFDLLAEELHYALSYQLAALFLERADPNSTRTGHQKCSDLANIESSFHALDESGPSATSRWLFLGTMWRALPRSSRLQSSTCSCCSSGNISENCSALGSVEVWGISLWSARSAGHNCSFLVQIEAPVVRNERKQMTEMNFCVQARHVNDCNRSSNCPAERLNWSKYALAV